MYVLHVAPVLKIIKQQGMILQFGQAGTLQDIKYEGIAWIRLPQGRYQQLAVMRENLFSI